MENACIDLMGQFDARGIATAAFVMSSLSMLGIGTLIGALVLNFWWDSRQESKINKMSGK